MFRLHRWLLDTGRPEGRPAWGKIIVGVSTIMFVVALVSGVAVWWPKTRRALRNGLKISVRKGSFRLWRSLHVAGGMYALLLLLAMALTGLTWSFPWYRSAFYAVFGVEMTAKGGAHGADDGKNDGGKERNGRSGGRRAAASGAAVWQKVYDRLRADNPHSASITVGNGTASVTFSKFGNSRAADRYTFDRHTGHITSAVKYADSAPSGKLRGWIYSVHTGTFGGLLTRVLWFIASLFGASLPLTGYWLWLRRLRKKRRGWPFTLRKATFCVVKGRLLQAERRPFGKALTVRRLQGCCKPFHDAAQTAVSPFVGMAAQYPQVGIVTRAAAWWMAHSAVFLRTVTGVGRGDAFRRVGAYLIWMTANPHFM